MSIPAEVLEALRPVKGLTLQPDAPLAGFTRFGIGGPADLVAETANPESFQEAVRICRSRRQTFSIIGEGSNLVVSDRGYRGVVLRYVARSLTAQGPRITADAGASLQELVDFSIAQGLQGLETLTGIPGSVGAAVYGNAGAYGHSISERVARVTFFDGEKVRSFSNAECQFDYRESFFKPHKDWMILRAELDLSAGDGDALRRQADQILRLRNEKFPPTMKCAGSIFKNLRLANLPEAAAAEVPREAVREGKVAAAFFLERVGAKGMRRGGIEVADYHANLIYNAGGGTAADLRAVIEELGLRVHQRFGIELEAEVQFLGEW